MATKLVCVGSALISGAWNTAGSGGLSELTVWSLVSAVSNGTVVNFIIAERSVYVP